MRGDSRAQLTAEHAVKSSRKVTEDKPTGWEPAPAMTTMLARRHSGKIFRLQLREPGLSLFCGWTWFTALNGSISVINWNLKVKETIPLQSYCGFKCSSTVGSGKKD